ncbi:Multidrug resistance-associated protein 1 [Allomyces javanicus]|nr:Multidrug resistance-associated protein 1 [Allomyces javanicus]
MYDWTALKHKSSAPPPPIPTTSTLLAPIPTATATLVPTPTLVPTSTPVLPLPLPTNGDDEGALAAWCSARGGFGPWDPTGNDTWDVTTCFQSAIINNFLVALLLVVGTLRLIQLRRRPAASAEHWGWHYWAKLIVIAALIAVQLTAFALASDHSAVDGTILAGQVAALALGLALAHTEHTRSRASSDVLLVIWLVGFFTSLLDVKHLAFHQVPLAPLTALAITTSVLYFASFVLELISKSRGDYELLGDDAGALVVDDDGIAAGVANPEDTANLFSRLSFWWLNDLMRRGQKNVLRADDLYRVATSQATAANYAKFVAAWDGELAKPEGPSLFRAIVVVIGPTFALAGLLKFVQDLLAFAQPALLQRLIAHESVPQGVAIAIGMFLVAMTQSLFVNQYFQLCLVVGTQLRTALTAAVYHKALRLSLSAKSQSSTGQLVNIMSVDVQKLSDLLTNLHVGLWSGPLQIGMSLYLLWDQLGPAVLVGLAIMILVMPVHAAFAKRQSVVQKDQMTNKDHRLKLMDEFLSGIKVIKLYAWEQFFLGRINHVRYQEMRNLRKYGYLNAATSSLWMTTPFTVAFATFFIYLLTSGEQLTPSKAFVSLSLFNLLQFPMTTLPSVIASVVDSSVSLNRIYQFLTAEEVHNEYLHRHAAPAAASSAVKAEVVRVCGSFAWAKTSGEDDLSTPGPVLNDLNLKFLARELVCVIGKVGGGKSSLLTAILGEMRAVPTAANPEPRVDVTGSLAYVRDESWLLNASIRDNILFGAALDDEWYAAVIRATCLDVDLAVLPDGDLCLVGEKGVSLSGGQKKRLAIARAVYSRHDVYLLDDPLSALDAQVGRQVFDACFGPNGLLKDKCRILVTHQLHFLSQCQLVVNLRDGRVSELGTLEYVKSLKGDTMQLLSAIAIPTTTRGDDGEDDDFPSPASSSTAAAPKTVVPFVMNKGDQPQLVSETMASGSIPWSVYMLYLKSCSWRGVALFLAVAVANQAMSMSANIWLKYTVSHDVDNSTFLTVYGLIGVGFAAMAALMTIVGWVVCGIRAARSLHNRMLSRVAAYKMEFFDTQPVGRVMNRFAKDVNVVDETLPRAFQYMVCAYIAVLSVTLLISAYTPAFLAAMAPLAVAYWILQRIFLASSRELRRLDSVSRSPVYTHFGESLDGLTVIRAFGHQARFVRGLYARVDDNLRAYYLSTTSNRWLAVRLELIGAMVVFAAALLMVLTHADSAVIGLTLTYALNMTGTLSWTIRQLCEVESNIVAVERIHEYSELPVEAPAFMPTRPPPHWPNRGEIQFEHFATRYRAGLDLVLHDIDVTVPAACKVGIVGRTGSGKSSTLLALFRVLEAAEGRIVLDGVDIATVGLYDLRSRITIIPQDPILFSGTIRANLDPFDQHDDMALWHALDAVQLHDTVSALPGKLSHEVAHGATLSLGQRQLVCLARAMLRHSQVLVLDEATAQIDLETDRIVQQTIRAQFAHCTILTIAHRVNTVIDSDLILVLANGRVVEYDAPQRLLAQNGSVFRALVEESSAQHH